jgi:carboxyl-terminal processing protease
MKNLLERQIKQISLGFARLNRSQRSIKAISASVSIFLLFAFVSPGEKYFEIAKNIDIFTTLFKEVNAHYVDEVDPKKLIDTGIAAMLESLDPYTDYIPEENSEAFSILTTGQYAGIGALIGSLGEKTIVTEPYEGFPAHQAGIQVGDELIEIDGKNVIGKTTQETSALLKGKPDTPVEVTIRRMGKEKPFKFNLRRQRIKISNVKYAELLDGKVGYIKLDDFTPGAGKEVIEAVTKLKASGATSLILDLRGNPGGLLHEAVTIANVFIDKDKDIVATKGKLTEWNKAYKTVAHAVDAEIPLAVLINQNSASASEIVAGALQDYDRALLVGQRTFGKGLVQTTRQLPYHAQVKITTAKYYIPSGRCIQELDYTHRQPDGTVKKIADSLKREFKTAGGRKVYDGGGLSPDIEVGHKEILSLPKTLITSGSIFEYASIYCATHPKPETLFHFKLTDAEYTAFTAWMKGKKIKYSTDIEQQLENLVQLAKKENASNLLTQLAALKAKVEQNKSTDLIRFKEEIAPLLEQQIAFHYKLDKGLVEVTLQHDQEVKTALKLLLDRAEYKRLLTAN